ncbi:ROK family glucokinase [Marinococcus luteus]|uniref:ROK family glucokinase n=1 Tax=Marinococcus luteus TaxID=1122204 RepID=UPI002ACD15AF|nr:ROK family glucokinase [Marinococcus luteus]MDZ5782986.1 ROK family glucokinase [Marinococcus luteus]
MAEKYVIGIDIGGTAVKMAIFGQGGDMQHKWSITTSKEENGKYVLNEIAASIRHELDEKQIPLTEVAGAGAGLPGFIDIENGIIEFATNIGWKDYPVARILEEKLGFPVALDNDANLAAAGEYWKGAGTDVRDMIFITLGTGVGGGIVLNGDLVNGKDNMAGEIGHITVKPEGGRLCNCGKRGCLETISSATGMVRGALEHIDKAEGSPIYDVHQRGEEITTKDLFAYATSADPYCAGVIDHAMYYLGLAVGNMANTLNPERIVIGGGVAAAGDDLLQTLRAHFDMFALDKVKKGTDFVIADLGNDAGVAGAAWLAKNHYLNG